MSTSTVANQPAGQPFHRPFIIGVAGGTASGKTTVCEKIVEQLNVPSVAMLTMDRFYKSLTEEQLSNIKILNESTINQSINQSSNQSVTAHNFDAPAAFDFDEFHQSIKSLINQSITSVPIYDYKTHSRLAERDLIDRPNVVIVEGILTLYAPEIRDLFDLKLFVDTDDDVRLARRIIRDISGRGRSVNDVLNQYLTTVKPAFQEFCEPTKRYADIIIPRGGENVVAIDLLVQHIKRELHKRGVEEIHKN